MPTDSRYRIPEDELYSAAQVPPTEQVEMQSEPVLPPLRWAGDPLLGDGGGDVDGD